MFWVNYFQDDFCLLEDSPQGDASVPLELEERAAKALAALMDLESLELSHALAAVFNAGIQAVRTGRAPTIAASGNARPRSADASPHGSG